MTGPANRSPRVAVVTGAAGGLGLAIARRLAGDGFTVASLDIDEPDDTGSIPGGRAWRCDVVDPAATRQAVHEIAEEYGGGRIDVLVNNAGLLSGRAPLLETSPEDMHRFFAVNAVGPLLMVLCSVVLFILGTAFSLRHVPRVH